MKYIAAILLACLSTPALAQPYARLAVGTSVNDHSSRRFGDYLSTMETSGLNIDGSIGYDLGPVRVEVEGQYSRIKAYKQGCFTCGPNGTFIYDDAKITGSAKSQTAMANILYDFPSIGEFLQISVGAGAGYSKVKIATESNGFIPEMRGKDSKLTVQGILEARAWITDHTAITYRMSYQHMGRIKVDALNASTNKRYAYHNYTLGLTQIF